MCEGASAWSRWAGGRVFGERPRTGHGGEALGRRGRTTQSGVGRDGTGRFINIKISPPFAGLCTAVLVIWRPKGLAQRRNPRIHRASPMETGLGGRQCGTRGWIMRRYFSFDAKGRGWPLPVMTSFVGFPLGWSRMRYPGARPFGLSRRKRHLPCVHASSRCSRRTSIATPL